MEERDAIGGTAPRKRMLRARTVLADAPSRTLELLREVGPRETARRAFRKVTSPWIELGGIVIFARDLGGPLPEAEPGPEVREVSAAELPAVERSSDPERSREVLRERFRRGHRCFLVEPTPRAPGHTRWVREDDPHVPELGRPLRLAPGDVYLYDGFTHPDARRQGLDGRTRCAIFRACRRRGARRVVSYVRSDNPAGLRAAGRWQERIAEMRTLRLGGTVFIRSGREDIAPLELGEPSSAPTEEEVSARSRRWQAWFRGWLEQPPEKRSTGFSFLPSEYFDAMAAFIADRLELGDRDQRVLDVGCASAGVTRRLAPLSREVVGVDATPGLVADASTTGPGEEPRGAGGLRLLASDARRLPFPSNSFDRVNCTGVLHTLPSEDDGRRVLRELVRVCRPGGRILVGALPDRRRRRAARREVWRRGDLRDRLEVLGGVLLPRAIRRPLRRWFGREGDGADLVALEYDLPTLARQLESGEIHCRLTGFPEDFWSRDFRTTRTNLVIDLDEEPASRSGDVRTAEERGTRTLAEGRRFPTDLPAAMSPTDAARRVGTSLANAPGVAGCRPDRTERPEPENRPDMNQGGLP